MSMLDFGKIWWWRTKKNLLICKSIPWILFFSPCIVCRLYRFQGTISYFYRWNPPMRPSSYRYSLSWRISTGSSPRGFWMGVMRFCFWWSIMEGGMGGWPGDCVWGGMTGEAAGGTEGGAGEGLPVGWGGISFCGALDGAAAFTIGPRMRKRDGIYFRELMHAWCSVYLRHDTASDRFTFRPLFRRSVSGLTLHTGRHSCWSRGSHVRSHHAWNDKKIWF